MNNFSELLQSGSHNMWLFIPTAILLGALHGLEPGHSKTMMAAFIIAIRGTVKQAIMLGVAATISHTAVVWLLAMLGLYLGNRWSTENTEPYFQLLSGVIIISIALWMLARTRKAAKVNKGHSDLHAISHKHEDGDAHAAAHAREIEENYKGREVTNGQIILFGLTGGLLPCPAAVTVLLVCLQLKKIALGAALVMGFSVGLAITLVMFGVVAAIGIRHASRSRFGAKVMVVARSAPYISAVIIIILGIYIGYEGLVKLV